MRSIIFGFIFVVMASLHSQPSFAQSKKELAAQNAALAARLDRLESRMLTGDPAAEALMARMDTIEAANRNLTGEIERLRFERDNLRAEVKALVSDIREMQELSTKFNIHLDAVELVSKQGGQVRSYAPRTYGDNSGSSQSTYVDPTQPSAIQGPPTLNERPLLRDPSPSFEGQAVNDLSNLPNEGRQKLAQGDFSGAQSLFQQYLTLQPEADDRGEVSFWLGETYFVKGGYADAADAYIQSMRTDRDGVKAPDAMIRLAASLRELGNKDQACQTLDSFLSQYPNASEAIRNKRDVELGRTGC
ncbi:MAG: tol-pal system protein YbgF [Maricaulaceae bacterium]